MQTEPNGNEPSKDELCRPHKVGRKLLKSNPDSDKLFPKQSSLAQDMIFEHYSYDLPIQPSFESIFVTL